MGNLTSLIADDPHLSHTRVLRPDYTAVKPAPNLALAKTASSLCRKLLIRHDCHSAPGASGGVLVQGGLIIGMHIGSIGQQKIATVIDSNISRPIDFSLMTGLVLEYNCDSDCKASATHSFPYICKIYHICHKDTVEPAELSACLVARSSDCSAKAAAADLSRLKNSLRAENNRLAASAAALSDQLNAVTPKIRDLDVAANAAKQLIAKTKASASSVSSLVTLVDGRTASVVTQATGVQQAVAVEKHELQIARDQRDQLVKENASVVEQAQSIAAALNQTIQLGIMAAAEVSRVTDAVTAAQAAALPWHQQLASSQTVLSLAKAPKIDALPTGMPTILAPTATDIASRIQSVDHKVETWSSPKISALVHSITHRVGPQIRIAIGVYYQKTARYLAKIDPLKSTHEMYYIGRLKVLQRCLVRAQGAVYAYKAHLQQNGMMPLTPAAASGGLPYLANATKTLNSDMASLAAALAEVQANHCDSTGMDQPLHFALIDAEKWQTWLVNKRVMQTTASLN